MGRALLILISFIIIFFAPLEKIEAQSLNAGLVSGIWYSKMPFFAGETVRIYTAIQNNSGFDIKGKVQFFKDEELIGESGFSALKGTLTTVWTDWKAKEGIFKISAEIVEAKPPSLTSFSVAQDNVFVDRDTDRDQIGNSKDPDDDNDNLTDEKEKILGTNPLNPDTDGDGIPDSQDIIVAETRPKEPQNKFISQVEKKTKAFLGNLKEKLEAKKEILEQKIKKERNPQPIFSKPNLLAKYSPTRDELQNFLLAGAIAALSNWKLIALIFFVLLAFSVLRKIF